MVLRSTGPSILPYQPVRTSKESIVCRIIYCTQQYLVCCNNHFTGNTDYGRPVRKSSLLHGRKSNPNPKFIDTAEAYFACHIGLKFQVSLIYAFIGCSQSVKHSIFHLYLHLHVMFFNNPCATIALLWKRLIISDSNLRNFVYLKVSRP